MYVPNYNFQESLIKIKISFKLNIDKILAIELIDVKFKEIVRINIKVWLYNSMYVVIKCMMYINNMTVQKKVEICLDNTQEPVYVYI